MNDNLNEIQKWEEIDADGIDFDQLENNLDAQLEEQLSELQDLEIEHDKIGNPDALGETIKNVVWEQFLNQIGVQAGEDFIKENRDMTLDLRDSAHIQTGENFHNASEHNAEISRIQNELNSLNAKIGRGEATKVEIAQKSKLEHELNGYIACHNDAINYQEKYDNWQSNFQHDEKDNVVKHPTRTGKEEATLVKGARKPFDNDRPTGSKENGTDMDHTVSAGEIIRDPEVAAHTTQQEQIAFSNSSANLNEMASDQNRSKGDKSMTDWLDTPNAKGQKPDEIYDISEELDQQYRDKDAEARKEFEELIKEGEKRSKKTGTQSKKNEAKRIGGKALRAVVMTLLADLIKDIIRKLAEWFRSGKREFKTFIGAVKEAIHNFITNIKEHLLNAGNVLVTTIATAIVGPVVGVIKKAWILLKQGYSSVKNAIKFLKDPANKNMPFSIKMLEVGKIVIAGLTAGGAIVLGEVIEKGLLAIPVFATPIPLLGSLANILGLFFGALVSGIIGALALDLIDRIVAKKQKRLNEEKQIEKKNEILATQGTIKAVAIEGTAEARVEMATGVYNRHEDFHEQVSGAVENMKDILIDSDEIHKENQNLLGDIDSMLDD